MNKRKIAWVLTMMLLAVCVLPVSALAKSKQMEDDVPVWTEETVKQYVTDYIGGREMSRLWGYYDLQIRRYMPLETYECFLTNLEWMTGKFIQFGSYRSFEEDELQLKTHVLHLCMEKKDLELYFTHKNKEDDWEVMAVQFVPAEKESYDPSVLVGEEEPNYTETEVSFGTETFPLKGTLTMPVEASQTNPVPACVLVHDSGAMDRDETLGSTHFFADLAQAFADLGIATLRYDKRTYLYGESASMTVEEEVIDDAVLAGKYLSDNLLVDSSMIVVVGHGFGGTLAHRVAKASDGVFSAVIMVGSTALSYEDYLLGHSNLSSHTADELKAYQDTLDKLSKMKEQTALENTETVLGHNVYYFWELQKINNYELIRKLRLPTYIVQGKKDPLVPENEGWRQYNNKIGEGVKYVTYRSFPGLNHVLMSDSSTDAYGLPQYTENATLDISAGRSIGQWILSLKSTAE